MEEVTVGVVELSRAELESCGVAGRWCPLRAYSSSSAHQGTAHQALENGCDRVGRGIVGEALVAFAWMQQGPATDVLPKAPEKYSRVGKSRKGSRRRGVERSRDSEWTHSENRRGKEKNNATNANGTHHAVAEHGNNDSSGSNHASTQQETLVYLHVWDALVPLDWPRSACYFTARLCCRGSRAQRVSTKPVRGKGGLRTNTTADGNDSRSSRASTSRARRSSRAGSMHVVWDEHLLLSVKGLVEEGTVVELLLRDASVDEDTTLAAREGEPFQAFAERNSLADVGMPTNLAHSYSSSSFCQPKIPGPAIYRLRLQHPQRLSEGGGIALDEVAKDEGSERSFGGFDGVEVRMAGLVVIRNGANVDHDEASVEGFLQRKADVAGIPGPGKRRLSTIGGHVSRSAVPSNLLLTQGIRLSRRRARLLDLSAANCLFRQFADDEAGGICTVETAVNTGCSSPKKGESMKQYPSSSEPMLTDDGLRLVAQQYFPGLAHRAGYAGVDAVNAASQQLTYGQCLSMVTTHQDKTKNIITDSISFAGFVSWLRKLPQEDLGAAGLLVSPRTALHKTGVVMHEDAEHARELANMLEFTREPSETLVGDWCSIALRSTMDAVVMDRVRIGWGRGGGGYGDANQNGVGDEKAESTWRRHTKMLRRDVAVLGKALAEVEQRCSRGNATITKEYNDTNTGTIGDGVGDYFDVATVVAGATKGMEETTELDLKRETDGVPSMAEHGTEAATVGPAVATTVGQEESGCCSVVALYLGQQVDLLGSAAEHLKEALRCAGDTLNRNMNQNPDHQFARGENTRARTTAEKEWSRFSNDSNQELLAAGKNTHYNHRHYGLLLQLIKQVTSFQAEISALQQRTTAVIALRRRGKTGCYSYVVPCDTELPRSALSLVKRIRRTQNAARCQQPLDASSPACDGIEIGGESLFLSSLEQDGGNGEDGDCLHSLQSLDNPDSLTGENDGVTKKRLRQNRAPGQDPPAVIVEPQHSARAPLDDVIVSSSSLQPCQRRLESIRAGFHEKMVDLPAGFSSVTAERVLKTARGREKNSNEASTMRLAPPAALCCPIDR